MNPAQTAAVDIRINGVVQGVGFRPFVHNAAHRFHLQGRVTNTSGGVLIHAEGNPESIESFFRFLEVGKPPLVHITRMAREEGAVEGLREFTIETSIRELNRRTLVSPDVSVCADCIREMNDPSDRRFGYPFINCTNCGPRYTIIDDLPYDRPNTSMKAFRMCARCQAEYDNPQNRRFHAQPNACPECGPHVELLDASGRRLPALDPIRAAADLLKAGKIVAIKGLGGFHLACDAIDEAAVSALRLRKRREAKPLAVMSPDLDQIRMYAVVTPEEERLLTSPARPIVLLACRNEVSVLASGVAPGQRHVGVMLPYTPLHHRILAHGCIALVMTSGNRSDEPIVIENADALKELSGIADFYLIHNRPIVLRTDDSVVRHAAGGVRPIRRSRGYVPLPVFLNRDVPPILACGAQIKNTVCLTRGNEAFLSQHIGDLENPAALDYYRFTIDHLKCLLDVVPEAIAHDAHPDYLSSRYALTLEGGPVPVFPVQHHHAHIAACMAENRLDGPVIGVACDGTGYGDDGTIWGCEILVADYTGYRRAAWISPVPMPGGDAAVREPYRMALGYLFSAFGKDCLHLDLPFLEPYRNRLPFLMDMIEKRIHCPLTSSLGRLFDGIAAILGLCCRASYEGQAAMELEAAAANGSDGSYEVGMERDPNREGYIILLNPMVAGIIRDLSNRTDSGTISRKFHHSVIRFLTEAVFRVSQDTGIDQIALSGGSFQNAILLEGLMKTLCQKKLNVYTHSLVPANDGGLALGQAAVAAARILRGKQPRENI